MPKQVFDGQKVTIELDLNDPKDKVKDLKKQNKGKKPKDLTDKEKADLFDAYVDAGVITL